MMPCYTVVQQSVNLAVASAEHLAGALKVLGAEVYSDRGRVYGFYFQGSSYSVQGGKITGPASSVVQVAGDVKRAYSVELLKAASKRAGWAVQGIPGKRFEFNVTKRGL